MPRRGQLHGWLGACTLFAVLTFAAAALAEDALSGPAVDPQSPAPWADPAQFGALAFTADGSFASIWKIASKEEAEARVRNDCRKYERGTCEVVSFSAKVCAAIATAAIAKDRKITYAGGGLSRDEAEEIALTRCQRDKRSKGTCELRTTVCGDGR